MPATATSYLRPILFDLIGAHLDGDPVLVSEIAGQIERFGRLREVLAEANFYGQFLAGCGDQSGDPGSAEFIGAGIRARLAAVLPFDQELAAVESLAQFAIGEHRSSLTRDPITGDDALLLQVMAAGIAELGTRVFGEDFSADQLGSVSEMTMTAADLARGSAE